MQDQHDVECGSGRCRGERAGKTEAEIPANGAPHGHSEVIPGTREDQAGMAELEPTGDYFGMHIDRLVQQSRPKRAGFRRVRVEGGVRTVRRPNRKQYGRASAGFVPGR